MPPIPLITSRSFRKNCKKDVKMRLKSVFPLKKFGNPILKQYLRTTRTRQASPRCSNVRVVLFLYNKQQNSIPEALHQCARPCLSLAVKRLDGYRYSKGWELSRINRTPSVRCFPTVWQEVGLRCLQMRFASTSIFASSSTSSISSRPTTTWRVKLIYFLLTSQI